MVDDEQNDTGGGLTGSIKRLLESGSGFLSSKFELVSIELQEEKRRILELLVLAAFAMLFAVLALMVVSFTIIILVPDQYRANVLIIMSLLYITVSALLFMRLQRKANLATKIFETTAEELKKDTEWVKRHL